MPVPAPAPRDRRRVLIAEDDGMLNETLVRTFSAHGFEPVPAWDGLQALALLNEELFDLLVIDIRMSMMDGIGLLEIRHERGLKVPVIVLSGILMSMSEERLETIRILGASAILSKPCPMNVLMDTARTLTGQRSTAALSAS